MSKKQRLKATPKTHSVRTAHKAAYVKPARDKIVMVRTTLQAFDDAKALGLNVSETLGLVLIDIVDKLKKGEQIE